MKASFTLEKDADVLKLGNVVLTVAAVLDQLWPIFEKLWHGVLHVELVELVEDDAPVRKKIYDKNFPSIFLLLDTHIRSLNGKSLNGSANELLKIEFCKLQLN